MFNTVNKNKIELASELIKAKYKADTDLILYYHFIADMEELRQHEGIPKHKKEVF